jgi:bifunctional DNA-binding transcriptional regulator/antitoxin component of YhaV-PrlF toxin-antitoxin module
VPARNSLRRQVKKLSPEERIGFFTDKINSGAHARAHSSVSASYAGAGQYTIPVAIKEKLNEETGDVEIEVGGIKARSGFARNKSGAKATKLADDVLANLTTDPGVYSAMQSIEGKEFSPPDVFDALGNRLTWDMLTENGSKTQFACAAVVEVQILGEDSAGCAFMAMLTRGRQVQTRLSRSLQ